MKVAMTKLVAALLIATAVLGGCSKPTEAIIPSDVSAWDKELAPHLKKLSDEDRELVAGYLMRAKMGEVFGGKGVAPGTTIGQALASQKAWRAEQAAKRVEEEALKKKLEQERATATDQLNKVVTVTLIAKQEMPKNYDAGRYSEYQQFQIGVQNNSDKPVMGVAGEIKFIDVFDTEVGAVSFRVSEDIAPGKSATWTGGARLQPIHFRASCCLEPRRGQVHDEVRSGDDCFQGRHQVDDAEVRLSSAAIQCALSAAVIRLPSWK